MCSAAGFIVLYICVKFCENISDDISIMKHPLMEALKDAHTDDTQNF